MGGKGQLRVWKGLALGKGSGDGKEDSDERAGAGCQVYKGREEQQ